MFAIPYLQSIAAAGAGMTTIFGLSHQKQEKTENCGVNSDDCDFEFTYSEIPESVECESVMEFSGLMTF